MVSGFCVLFKKAVSTLNFILKKTLLFYFLHLDQ